MLARREGCPYLGSDVSGHWCEWCCLYLLPVGAGGLDTTQGDTATGDTEREAEVVAGPSCPPVARMEGRPYLLPPELG